MSKKAIRNPLSLAIGAAVLSVSGMASAGDTGADNELFTMDLLDSAYLTADAGKEGSCGEGKCGEGKCGDDKDGDDKGGEGSCGGDKGGEGSCGGDKGGEGKCGGAT